MYFNPTNFDILNETKRTHKKVSILYFTISKVLDILYSIFNGKTNTPI
jgi:hypothetical protein